MSRRNRAAVAALGRALACASAILATATSAPALDLKRPDAHAPIGVMGDHVHHEGEWMFSYRYMRMRMDGNRDGSSKESLSKILRPNGKYVAAPTDMDMQMHMLGVMYAPADRLTLMLMLPFVQKNMDHRTALGAKFTTRSSGLGDISATALVKLWEDEMNEIHLNAGLSFPSGSISQKDDTPVSMGSNVLLPYPMQLGSGTVDLLPGLTYNGQQELFSWGAQARGDVPLGDNDENYRLGNQYAVTGWGAVKPIAWASGAFRMQWRQWFNISGKDDRLGSPTGIPAKDFIPTADPELRAGKLLELGPSINLLATRGPLEGLRFGVEALFPVYQSLDGPQLETDWTLVAGVQYAF